MIFVKTMHQYFMNELNSIYPTHEISAIFYQLTTHFDKIRRIDVSLDPTLKINQKKYAKYLQQLKQNVPLQHITGTKEFYDLSLTVNKDVLIPRPETEELVDWIIADNKHIHNLNIIDIGTGSGAIAIALSKHLDADITAIDICEKALAIASKNASDNNTSILFINKDILNDISCSQSFDIVVSNPPYIPFFEADFMQKNVLDFDPHKALFVPNDSPLIFYERIIDFAILNTNKPSLIYFEIHENSKEKLIELLKKYNLNRYQFKKDIFNKFRLLKIFVK